MPPVNPWKFYGSAVIFGIAIVAMATSVVFYKGKTFGQLCSKEHAKYSKGWHDCVDAHVKGSHVPEK